MRKETNAAKRKYRKMKLVQSKKRQNGERRKESEAWDNKQKRRLRKQRNVNRFKREECKARGKKCKKSLSKKKGKKGPKGERKV